MALKNDCPTLKKVLEGHKGKWISEGASPSKPYGLRGDAPSHSGKDAVPCWFKGAIGRKTIDPRKVKDPRGDVGKWRVLVRRANGSKSREEMGMYKLTANCVQIAKPNEYCCETFIVLRSVESELDAKHLVAYIFTRFFRFMLRMRIVSQDCTRDNYRWVPDLADYSKSWTDAELYKMFGLTRQEQAYIQSKIKELK